MPWTIIRLNQYEALSTFLTENKTTVPLYLSRGLDAVDADSSTVCFLHLRAEAFSALQGYTSTPVRPQRNVEMLHERFVVTECLGMACLAMPSPAVPRQGNDEPLHYHNELEKRFPSPVLSNHQTSMMQTHEASDCFNGQSVGHLRQSPLVAAHVLHESLVILK